MKKKLIVTTTIASLMLFSAAAGGYAATKMRLIVDGKTASVDPIVINNVTYVPLRAAGEMLGANVQYEARTNTVTVSSTTKPETSPSSPSNTVTPGSDTKPSNAKVGFSRSTPAPVNTTITYNHEDYTSKYSAQFSVGEVIRGDAAWQMIKQRNQFNDPAPEGLEYVLAKISVKVLSNDNPNEALNFNEYHFKLISSEGKEYDSPSVVTPEELSLKLYPGASGSGYVALLVSKSDKNPVLTYGRDYKGTGGIWFKI